MGRYERRQEKERKDLQKEIAKFEAQGKKTKTKNISYGFVDYLLLGAIVLFSLLAVALFVLIANKNIWFEDGQIVWRDNPASLIAGAEEQLISSPDAGQEYIDETLFLGDSNTVRLGMYELVDKQQVLAKDSIGIEAVSGLRFIQQDGRTYTMLDIVTERQPLRVVMTFGTNNIGGKGNAQTFVEGYRGAVNDIRAASPGTQIIINSIPPIQKANSYPKISKEAIDEYNEALQAFCAEEGIPFLNSTVVLQDENGYLQKGYAEGDGIHLTKPALEAFLEYYRTHAVL